jgi:hypothetical protein
MKKYLSGILAAAVACGSAICLTTAAGAAEDGGYALSAAFDKAEAEKGKDLTMTINLDKNPGLVSIRFQVKYDPAVVTIEKTADITALEDFGVPGSFTTPKANNDTGNVTLRWSCPLSEENITKTGPLASIKFTVKPDAPVGSTGISFVPVEINMIDENLDFVDLDAKYGTDITGYFSTPSEADIDKLVKVACAHNWGEGTVTTEPTCTDEGVKTFTCSVCGETKTEDIEALGHNWDAGKVTKEPTCTDKGVKTFTCTRCNTAKTEDVEATDHNWDAGKITAEPTCTEKGVKTFTCSKCNETRTEEVAALGHDWGEWAVTKEATYDEEGEETRECKNCGEKETRAIAKLTPVITTTTYEGHFSVPEITSTTTVPAETTEATTTTATATTVPAETTAAPETTSTTAASAVTTPDNTVSGANTGNVSAGNPDDKNSPTGLVIAVIPTAAAAASVIIFKKKK